MFNYVRGMGLLVCLERVECGVLAGELVVSVELRDRLSIDY
jgi:hypothetical protein